MLGFDLSYAIHIDEGILATMALFFIGGTLVLWIRSFARSHRPGWLWMAAGIIVPTAGTFLESTYLWALLGGVLLFAGSMMLCRDLRKAPAEEEH